MEPLNEKSQIAQEYGLLPADARQQKVSEKWNKVKSVLISTTMLLVLNHFLIQW